MYTRFAVAAIGDLQARVELVTHFRLLMAEGEVGILEARRALRREMGAYARGAHAERMYAQFEVELVGTEPILPLAQRLDQAVSRAHQLGIETSDEDLGKAVHEAQDAVNAFIEACRAELWYAPRWWHLHRHVARWLREVGARCLRMVKLLLPGRRGRTAPQLATDTEAQASVKHQVTPDISG
ncbi:hypothetical protein [Streptomyces sp. SudanB52_2052]|uniref:hypothetical protein n=1 Tax=Streptomyces sp. SudanB52_2052 TaxID=3035276 RepID=UPI003F5783F2